ncbi:MAG: S49 family peptidase [Saprospiraceae bacterium]|nr:S49 family peptidase [Saprospiraceae bacterium]
MASVNLLSHPYIQNFLSGDLLLLERYGWQALTDFLIELKMMESGTIPYSELGISERRHLQVPEYFSVDLATGTPSKVARDKSALYEWYQSLPENSVAVVKLHGVMRSQSAASTRGVDMIERDLFEAYDNPRVSAVVLDVHSGGGEASAGFRMASAIQSRNKPVVALTHVAGSAAYLAASYADEIMISDGGEVGGIGALISFDMRIVNEYKEHFLEIYDPESSDKNLEYRQLKEGNTGPMTEMLVELATKFRGVVRANRELHGNEETQRKTLAGGMFGAREAKRRGLADSGGSLNKAILRSFRLAK